MPLKIDISDYLSSYRGSIQERDPFYSAAVARVTRDISEVAQAAYSQAAGGSRTYTIVTGTTIDVKAEREEAERQGIDLKPGLLGGRSARVSKKGVRYAIVPFSKRTPGRGRGGLYTLPSDVYRAALAGSRILPGSEMGMRFQRVGYGGEEWKTGPFANLTRYPGTYRGGASYNVFRTVSENSPPRSWIRPPFLVNKETTEGVREYMASVIPDIIASELGPPTFFGDEEEEEY